MNPFVGSLYAAVGHVAEAAAVLAPRGGGKLRRSLAARRGVVRRYQRWAAAGRDPSRPLLWMHAPSVGEGLQARPVLEALRRDRPELQLVYSYYSPSAVEFAARLDVDFRDLLPFDTAASAGAVLDAVRPSALVFSKLDVWPALAEAARSRRIPLGLSSATVPPGSSRLGPLAALVLRDAYGALDAVGAISDADAARLVELGCRPGAVTVTGDTRFDQVWARAWAANPATPLIAGLRSDRPTLVAGSTWPADESRLFPALERLRADDPALRVIIAPHEPTPAHLDPIERWASAAGWGHARLGSAGAQLADLVVVDRVGVLGELYALADIAFVGGAFHRAGIHSVLEPAAYGVPVLFGPLHANSREATLLLTAGGAGEGRDAAALQQLLAGWLSDPGARRAAGEAARSFVDANRGATQRTIALVERLMGGAPRR